MHVLVPGAAIHSSAGLRDSDIHAIRCADVRGQLRSSGCSISDSLIVPQMAPPTPRRGAVNRPLRPLLHFSISCLPGSPLEVSYSVRFSYHSTFLAPHSLQKIETERRREGR